MSTDINRVLIEVWHHLSDTLLKVLSDGTVLFMEEGTWSKSHLFRADIDQRRARTGITIYIRSWDGAAWSDWNETWKGDI